VQDSLGPDLRQFEIPEGLQESSASLTIGLIPWSPVARGLLAGALHPTTTGRRADEDLRKDVEKFRPRLEAFEQFCKETGEESAHIALAWLLHQKSVAAPIVGPRTVDQLQGTMRALEITLSNNQLQQLDTIFPGPGGPAPEAYAW